MVIPNTPPSTAAVKGKRRGSRGACAKKEVGGESCEEKEQKGGGYCSVHYNDWPLAVFCAKHRHGHPAIILCDIIANQL